MANMIQAAKDSVNALLAEACARAAEKGQLPAGAVLTGSVEIPKDTQNGDFAANHAMAGARALRMPPRKIAEALVENLDLAGRGALYAHGTYSGYTGKRSDQLVVQDLVKAREGLVSRG